MRKLLCDEVKGFGLTHRGEFCSNIDGKCVGIRGEVIYESN